MSVTSDSVIDALGLEGSKSSTYHFADVTETGDGWCMVRLNSETETRCADVYGAAVGDRAQVVIKQDGSCVAVGRRGGKSGDMSQYLTKDEAGSWETITVYQSDAYGFVRARVNRSLRMGILALDLKTFSGGWFLGGNAYSKTVGDVTASIPSECCPAFEFSGAAGAWTKSSTGTFWMRVDGKVAINFPTNDEYLGSLTWSW